MKNYVAQNKQRRTKKIIDLEPMQNTKKQMSSFGHIVRMNRIPKRTRRESARKKWFDQIEDYRRKRGK